MGGPGGCGAAVQAPTGDRILRGPLRTASNARCFSNASAEASGFEPFHFESGGVVAGQWYW
eukprot:scaffold111_cov252-Pinguiococcus_pyrenoidosus.AAC.10